MDRLQPKNSSSITNFFTIISFSNYLIMQTQHCHSRITKKIACLAYSWKSARLLWVFFHGTANLMFLIAHIWFCKSINITFERQKIPFPHYYETHRNPIKLLEINKPMSCIYTFIKESLFDQVKPALLNKFGE
jgi:hypothetical protein